MAAIGRAVRAKTENRKDLANDIETRAQRRLKDAWVTAGLSHDASVRQSRFQRGLILSLAAAVLLVVGGGGVFFFLSASGPENLRPTFEFGLSLAGGALLSAPLTLLLNRSLGENFFAKSKEKLELEEFTKAVADITGLEPLSVETTAALRAALEQEARQILDATLSSLTKEATAELREQANATAQLETELAAFMIEYRQVHNAFAEASLNHFEGGHDLPLFEALAKRVRLLAIENSLGTIQRRKGEIEWTIDELAKMEPPSIVSA